MNTDRQTDSRTRPEAATTTDTCRWCFGWGETNGPAARAEAARDRLARAAQRDLRRVVVLERDSNYKVQLL